MRSEAEIREARNHLRSAASEAEIREARNHLRPAASVGGSVFPHIAMRVLIAALDWILDEECSGDLNFSELMKAFRAVDEVERATKKHAKN